MSEHYEKLIFDIKKKREDVQLLKDIKESINVVNKSDCIFSINKSNIPNIKIKIQKVCQKK